MPDSLPGQPDVLPEDDWRNNDAQRYLHRAARLERERDEARADADRLRKALMAVKDVLGALHIVKEGPNAGWRDTDMSNGELGWYDDDAVPDPDCSVCAAERLAEEALNA